MTSPHLEVSGIEVSFGKLQVLFGVDLRVDRGARVGLLGTNGAGKSTLLRTIAGLVAPTSGSVRVAGEDVTELPAHERVGRGLALVEGGRATFPSLTVRENLLMGAYPFLADRRVVAERLEDAIGLFPHLAERLEQPAGTLSGGEQQMMAVGRAMVSGADLLLIDELSLGLAPVVLQEVVRAVEELARRGVTILLVEQSLNLASRIVSEAHFMEKGEIRYSGDIAQLLKRGDLVRSVFFGRRSARV